jgi:hypothetical protein
MQSVMVDFQIEGRMFRYSNFVPRFYNLCKSYGFEKGRIMPSRAFCSDENQGFPIILIAKHFGAIPFDHGMVGGIVATDRHGPHSHHGKDLVIIQASHVGYDPETNRFGIYRRLQMEPAAHTASCGKIAAVTGWYQREYRFARANVLVDRREGAPVVIIDNQFLDSSRSQGLFLNLERLLDHSGGERPEPLHVQSTSRVFRLNPALEKELPASIWQQEGPAPLGGCLSPEMFHFKRQVSDALEGRDQLECNLQRYMPQIVTSSAPALTSAIANTQVEFDRTYRTLLGEPGYQDKNLAFIAGINIDISPRPSQIFPLTKFVPWAAYFQLADGRSFIWEQEELAGILHSQSSLNPDRIELSKAIQAMDSAPEIKITPPR